MVRSFFVASVMSCWERMVENRIWSKKNKRSWMEQSKLKTKSIWPMPKRKNLQPVSKRNTLVLCLSSGHSEEVPEVHILCQARET